MLSNKLYLKNSTLTKNKKIKTKTAVIHNDKQCYQEINNHSFLNILQKFKIKTLAGKYKIIKIKILICTHQIIQLRI